MLAPANALRTDAGPSRPAAGPEAVFVTRGEGVSSCSTPRTTTPGTAIGECDHMCCSCHMYGYLWYTNLPWMRPGERDILMLAVHRSRTVIGETLQRSFLECPLHSTERHNLNSLRQSSIRQVLIRIAMLERWEMRFQHQQRI